MKLAFEKYKGIHPGLILERELEKLGINKRQFAISVDEHPQTINAITKGKRKIPLPLSIRIDKALGVQEGTMSLMHTFYEVEEYKRQQLEEETQDFISQLRSSLFWDTDIKRINLSKDSDAIIKRVYERGNDEEKELLKKRYGAGRIKKTLKFYEGIQQEKDVKRRLHAMKPNK